MKMTLQEALISAMIYAQWYREMYGVDHFVLQAIFLSQLAYLLNNHVIGKGC